MCHTSSQSVTTGACVIVQQQDPVKQQRRMGTIMQALAWVVFLVLGAFYFSGVLERQYNPNQDLDTMETPQGAREVVLRRNRFGHYVTPGEINGQPVTFMLDTGATGVAVPAAVAERLGLNRGRAYRTQTANGTAITYAARLDSVSVGGIALQNVQAGITPGLQMDQVLLGMSFLKHIEFTQRGNTLILRQYP